MHSVWSDLVICGVTFMIVMGMPFIAFLAVEAHRRSSARCGNDVRDYLDVLSALSDRGDADAQYQLARLYCNGADGVEPDSHKALFYCRLAAESGHPDAQYGLGMFYHEGDMVHKDEKLALKWLLRAAIQGNARASSLVQTLSGTGEASRALHAG